MYNDRKAKSNQQTTGLFICVCTARNILQRTDLTIFLPYPPDNHHCLFQERGGRKIRPIWILMKQEMMGQQWH